MIYKLFGISIFAFLTLSSCRSIYDSSKTSNTIIPSRKVEFNSEWSCSEVSTGLYIIFEGSYKKDKINLFVDDSLVYSETLTFPDHHPRGGGLNLVLDYSSKVELQINDGKKNIIRWDKNYCYLTIKKTKSSFRLKHSKKLRYGYM